MMRVKSEKGSIALFVFIAVIFYTGFLLLMYASNLNKVQTISEKINFIKSIYEKNIETIEETYNRQIGLSNNSDPIIKELPNPIIANVTEISEQYVDYGGVSGVTEYIAFDTQFSSVQEIVDYVFANNKYGEAEIIIKAKSDNGRTVTSIQNITFEEPEDPIINSLPNPVITNVTTISDPYVQYDSLGGTTKYVVFNTEFSSMQEVVNYVIQNNRYEKVDITINAVGNNKKTATSTQNIEFIRGMTVTNETELKTALSSTDSLYISVASDITCTSTISIDNVTHKLDLNNHTISYTKTNESFTFITLGSNTNLTIFDSSIAKQGNILASLYEETDSDGTHRETNITCIKNNGVLTIESGTVSANSVQKMLAAKKNTNVDNSCTAINNAGTVNLNGGTVYSNIVTQGCTYLVVWSSIANARGIVNSGIVNLNSGAITTNADAYMVRPSGATVWGETYAYSYGIENSGTVNQNGSVTFTTTVEAHSGGTFTRDSDSADIK